jgi:serine/threonine protein kinase
MSSQASCPDVRVLQRFLLGRLPPGEAEPIAEHLLHCDHCAEAVRSLPADDVPEAGAVASQKPRLSHPAEASRFVERMPSAARSGVEELPDDMNGFFTPAQAADEIGRLGHYRILKVLGSGEMAVVFQAENVRLRRAAALKVLKPSMAGELARKRFVREAQAMAALDHENIIAVYEVDEAGGLPFLAMPMLSGETLHARLQRQKQMEAPWLSLPEVLQVGREIAAGLAAAHERGLIHRDIKPANIWLEERGGDEPGIRVKLLDFGIVRVASEVQRLTAAGAIIGTPAFMAPENAVDAPLDPRCDLFSLGCVLYRMATGQLAFNGPTPRAILKAVLQTEPPPPEALNPTLPPALTALIRQLLAKDREQRPASARDVAATLRAIEVGARESSAVPHIPALAVPPMIAESVPPVSWKARYTTGLLVFALVAAISVAAALLLLR